MSEGIEVQYIDFQIEGSRGTVGYFNFENSVEVNVINKDYMNGKIKVEPKTFITNLRYLKSEVNGYNKKPGK